MGLHTGKPLLLAEGYVGLDVHRAARIAHLGHGGWGTFPLPALPTWIEGNRYMRELTYAE